MSSKQPSARETIGVLFVDCSSVVIFCNEVAQQVLDVLPGKQLFGPPELLERLTVSISRCTCATGSFKAGTIDHLPFHIYPLKMHNIVAGAFLLIWTSNSRAAISGDNKISETANEELEAILDASYDEIFVTDSEGTVLRVNAACERLYGICAAGLVGKSVVELERQGLFSPSATVAVMQKRESVTMLQQTVTGRTLLVTAVPILDDQGNISKIVSNSRDISELVKLRDGLLETEKASERYRAELAEIKRQAGGLVWRSAPMAKVVYLAQKVAKTDSTVLLSGESGVGKNVVAQMIHRESRRAAGPFIEISCAAIPEGLLESELFGYEGGAFTGARREGKKGQLELAENGTLFLDEINSLPLSLQAKLLNVLQERQVVRVGGIKRISIDVRLIAATNKDLRELVREGKFREDLYYRLSVVPIGIPPLRERIEDIPILIRNALHKLAERGYPAKRVHSDCMNVLQSYSWPGNVRELENVIEQMVVFAEGDILCLSDIPEYVLNQRQVELPVTRPGPASLRRRIQDAEGDMVRQAFELYGSSYGVAKALGISQPTAVRKIQKYVKRQVNSPEGQTP